MKSLGIIAVKKEILFIFLISLIFFFIFSYKLESIPPGINGDEAAIGLNSILISETLRDENKRIIPLFILTLDKKEWKQPITIYSSIIVFKILGKSLFNLRLVSVFIALVSVTLLFLILKQIFANLESLIGLLIFSMSPLLLIQSHLASENIAPLPFICFWILMMFKYFKLNRNIYLLLGSISLGLSIFSYNGMRLIVPVYALVGIGAILLDRTKKNKSKLESLRFFLAGFLPTLLFIAVGLIKYPGALLNYNQPVHLANYQDFFLPYLSSFDLSFLFLKGDATAYHSTGKHGMFLFFTLPFFLTGIYQGVAKKSMPLYFALACFFLTPIFFGLTDQIYRASRLMALMPFFAIISTQGISFLLKKSKLIFFLILCLVFINYIEFVSYYWNEYPRQVVTDFSSTSNITFKELSKYSKKYKLKPVILWDYYQKESSAAKFFEKAYFSKPLKMWRPGVKLLDGDVLLASSADKETLNKQGFRQIKSSLEEYSIYVK